MRDLTFIGCGLKFPFQFSERTGAPAVSSELDRINESIIQILGTRIGERLMRPDFGSKVKDLLFEQNDAVLKGLLRYHIMDALKKWEKRIVVTGVTVDDSANQAGGNILVLCVTYRVVESQVEGDLVWALEG